MCCVCIENTEETALLQSASARRLQCIQHKREFLCVMRTPKSQPLDEPSNTFDITTGESVRELRCFIDAALCSQCLQHIACAL